MNQGSKENYQTKPISNNPAGINGLRRVSSTTGPPGLAKPDRSLHRDTRGPLPKGKWPRGPATGDNGPAKLPSNKMTKQTQFCITVIDPAAYQGRLELAVCHAAASAHFSPRLRRMRRKAHWPRLAVTVCVHRPAYSMSASGRDESRPYIPDRGHLLPMGYPLDSGNPNILWLGSRGLSVPVGDDRSIRRWVHGDCLLHKAVEEFSPAA